MRKAQGALLDVCREHADYRLRGRWCPEGMGGSMLTLTPSVRQAVATGGCCGALVGPSDRCDSCGAKSVRLWANACPMTIPQVNYRRRVRLSGQRLRAPGFADVDPKRFPDSEVECEPHETDGA